MDATETHTDAPAAPTQADDAIERGPRVMTLREAACWLQSEGVDLSYDGLRTLVDRKKLGGIVHRNGKRYIEMRALRGLAAARRSEQTPPAAAAAPVPQIDVEALFDRVVDAERRAAAAETRGMIAEQSESTLSEALHEARTQIAVLEEQLQRRRSWFRRRRSHGG